MPLITKLRYVEDSARFKTEVAYELFGHPNSDSPKITNCTYVEFDQILVEDVRDNPAVYTLQDTGFTYVKHKSHCSLVAENFETAGSDLNGNDSVSEYLEETMILAKRLLSADRAICFDWRFRRSAGPSDIATEPMDLYDVRYQAVLPGYLVHTGGLELVCLDYKQLIMTDFSHDGGLQRLEMHLLPEELARVKAGTLKAKIIKFEVPFRTRVGPSLTPASIWRPLTVVKNAPFIVTDVRSVLRSDLVEVEKILPDKVERSYLLKHSNHHRWYYMSDQKPDEVAVFIVWDCDSRKVTADYPPHGAAASFAKDPLEKPRESLEVRLIMLTEN